MARPNSIDHHEDRAKIVALIAAGIASNADIARRFGVSEDAVSRYRRTKDHKVIHEVLKLAVPKDVTPAQDDETTDSDPWVAECDKLRALTRGIAERCVIDAPSVALQAARETRETLRFSAELAGRLSQPGTAGPSVTIVMPNVLIASPQPQQPQVQQAKDVLFLPAGASEPAK